MGVKMHAHSFTPDKLLPQSDSVTSLIYQVITKNIVVFCLFKVLAAQN